MAKKVAILIDGDNISAKYARYIKQEALQYGDIQICRMYGSITSPSVRGWYKVMPEQGIMPILQISYSNGKSVADQALTIDAMDMLYTTDIDVFCLVSSDSDFTKLAYRIKEFGKDVIGMGEQKTKEALAKACDEFKILDLIYKDAVETEEEEPEESAGEVQQKESGGKAEAEAKSSDATGLADATIPEDREAEIAIPTEADILDELSRMLDEEEWSNLSVIGVQLSQRRPGFDARNYGYRNMSAFVKNHQNRFEVEKKKAQDNIHDIVYVKKRVAEPQSTEQVTGQKAAEQTTGKQTTAQQTTSNKRTRRKSK